MSGKRLLDAIQILNVAKSVATKHLAVRQRQLDIYTRTSSLTKGIKNQTDGLILTAKAAAALAKRFNDPHPHEAVPQKPAASTTTTTTSASTPPPSTNPTISHQTNATSSHPATLIGNSESIVSTSRNAESKTPPSKPETTAAEVDGQQDIPEEMMKDIFHSPKVARLLSKKPPTDIRGHTFPVGVGNARDAVKGDAKTAEQEHVVEETIIPEKPVDGGIAAELQREQNSYRMVESRVPSSRLGRLWQYGGLATSMAFGAVGEGLRRVTGSAEDAAGSIMFNPSNMERLVAKLSKMRGAALKLGQMLSFQDAKMLPEPIQQVLQRVQDRADYMPTSQRDKVLSDNLGPNWRDLFSSFEEVPMAAASIGQVHGAVLKSTGQPVAVKVQYPGVADSIDSDLNNLSILLTASRLLPRGLYLDKTIANARTELGWECDYTREAECGNHFRQLLRDDPVFLVPEIIPEASGKNVLTMERLNGVAVTKIRNFTQDQRDWIGTQILRLCLREITEFKYMQTDPNWTNFLYNAETNRLELLDFGASREYPAEFITKYIETLVAASRGDKKTCHQLSIELGYLTGHESPAMVDAHVTSILTLAEPFMESSPDVYDFENQTITDRVRSLIPVMIRERLAPPPEETYSLHRKLSGAFLLCARLGSRVRCKELFQDAIKKIQK